MLTDSFLKLHSEFCILKVSASFCLHSVLLLLVNSQLLYPSLEIEFCDNGFLENIRKGVIAFLIFHRTPISQALEACCDQGLQSQ